jgi:hypothetical protein
MRPAEQSFIRGGVFWKFEGRQFFGFGSSSDIPSSRKCTVEVEQTVYPLFDLASVRSSNRGKRIIQIK